MKLFSVLSSGMLCSGILQAGERPDIIVILADDLGFSDIGCFGGEIETPVLDSMARTGIRMTQMYNSARSCPSRANLLTGLYPHQTGMGYMEGRSVWPRGYSGFRQDSDNVTIAELLKSAGYYTAMAGKWHLGKNSTPVDRGFQEYYGLLGGFDSMWNEDVYVRLPEGKPVREYGDGEFYATDAITDYAIDFMNEANGQGKPLFLYLAYNAPHFPLHAPKEMIDKYMDIYMAGWDKIRDERWKRICSMGLLQGHPELSPRGMVPESAFIDGPGHDLPSWDSLGEEHRKDLARRMATYAAMVDIMDSNIGRIFETIRKNGKTDDTFVIFLSDNGACAEWHEFGFDGKSGTEYHIHKGAELDMMGQSGTYHHYGTAWANACSTPFTLYKHFTHEGGISCPCIVNWGGNIMKTGMMSHQPAQFCDVMMTCLDLAGCEYPGTFEGREITPSPGMSLLPVLRGRELSKRYIFAEHEGNRMVRYGKWKLVSAHCRGEKWELYDITADRTEQNDLSAEYPAVVKRLEKAYHSWAASSDVLYFPKLWNTYYKKRRKDMVEYLPALKN